VPFTSVSGDNGRRRSIRIRIAAPRLSRETVWACPVQIVGVLRPTLVYGEDALQTMCLALEFIGNTLYSQRRRRLRLVFPTGHSVPLYAYFRLREMQRRFARLGERLGHRRSKRPPNKPLERAGMNPGRSAKRASAGRSAPSR
jgi:hypothetical protein